MTDSTTELDAEDAKLLTLARSTRARNGADAAAAVRDGDRRTYVATSVDLPSLRLTALQAAVATAVASGAARLQAAVIVAEHPSLADADAAVARDTATVAVVLADPDGRVREIVRP